MELARELHAHDPQDVARRDRCARQELSGRTGETMSVYDDICQRISGKGIQEYDQGEESLANRILIAGGVCRALVVMWLRAKKDNTSFWAARDTIMQPLMADINRLEQAVDLQAEYAAALE